MRFIDEVKISISSGKGGNGSASFRREKNLAFGGPDGGNGGDGGSVYFQASEGLNTLANFRGKRRYQAEPGGSGTGSQMNGKFGEDIVIPVPVGTIIRDAESQEVLADLTKPQEKVLLAEGGRGGLGNLSFKTSINQAPRRATLGRPGVGLEVELELKLLADIALIGMPNAGKSTLISTISAARPKIADYPFTTLEPNLGVVKKDEKSFVVADIPGLIEDASTGKGLGIKFLKHIERTSAFIHLIDISWCLDKYEAFDQYVTIRDELGKFNQKMLEKKELLCLTKIDAMSEDEINKFVQFFEDQLSKKVLPISSVSGRNIEQLKGLVLRALES